MLAIQDLIGRTTEITTEEDVLDFAVLICAATAEHLSRQDAKTKRKVNALKRAASVLSEFKVSLTFAPVPLLEQNRDS